MNINFENLKINLKKKKLLNMFINYNFNISKEKYDQTL